MNIDRTYTERLERRRKRKLQIKIEKRTVQIKEIDRSIDFRLLSFPLDNNQQIHAEFCALKHTRTHTHIHMSRFLFQ